MRANLHKNLNADSRRVIRVITFGILVFSLFLASISGRAQVASVDEALKKLKSVNASVTQEYYQKLGYIENLKALGTYNKQWLDDRTELTQRVKSAPYYLEALEAAKASSDSMAKLRALNTKVSDDEFKEYSAATRLPSLIRKRDIDEDASLRKLLSAIATCQANIRQIQSEAARLTASDPRVIASKGELEQMRANEAAAAAAAAADARADSDRRRMISQQDEQNENQRRALFQLERFNSQLERLRNERRNR